MKEVEIPEVSPTDSSTFDTKVDHYTPLVEIDCPCCKKPNHKTGINFYWQRGIRSVILECQVCGENVKISMRSEK